MEFHYKKEFGSGSGKKKKSGSKFGWFRKISFNSPVILGMVGICFLATLLNYLTFGKANAVFFTTSHGPLYSPMTWIRWVTHIFGHADWSHFGNNMCYILLLGPMLEEKYGSKTLAVVMGITAVSAGILNYILFPTSALCGASGVVFAFMLLASFTSFREGEIPLTFLLVAVFFIGQQVVEGITVRDNISNSGHILGGIVGSILGYRLNVRGSK